MQVKILTFFYTLVNEQNYDKSIDNYIFLEYSLNMLTANICSIQKGGIMLLELENHLNSKYQDVTNYVIKKSQTSNNFIKGN